MQVALAFHDSELADDALAQLAREVCLDLNREGVAAEVVEKGGEPGSRSASGDIPMWLDIAKYATSIMIGYSAKEILFDLAKQLRAHLERRATLASTIVLPDGRTLAIKKEDLQPERIELTAKQLQQLVESQA